MLDPKFSDFRTSTLEFKIKPSPNNILVEVEYAPPPRKEGEMDETMLEEYGTE
jgi:hypothetical protein